MAMINKLPDRVHIVCSPDELRKLADKMEARIANVSLGEDTLVEVWQGGSIELMFYFDQDKAIRFVEKQIGELKAGDVLMATPQMPFEVAQKVEGCRYDPANRCWLLYLKGIITPLRFTDMQIPNLRFMVRIK